jgi:hypothetical protein
MAGMLRKSNDGLGMARTPLDARPVCHDFRVMQVTRFTTGG